MRSAAQTVSYEVPAGVVLLGMLLIAGSLDMHKIIEGQKNGFLFNITDANIGFLSWYVFRYPPFTIAAVIVYFTVILVESNRTPFDIPEAESELVAGYHTEYSGMRFSFFFLSEYANMLIGSAIVTTVFLGGWLPPYGEFLFGELPVLKFCEGLFWFLGKCFFLVFVMMWLRWTLPRYRVDQVMELSWKKLLPLAFINFIVIGIFEICR